MTIEQKVANLSLALSEFHEAMKSAGSQAVDEMFQYLSRRVADAALNKDNATLDTIAADLHSTGLKEYTWAPESHNANDFHQWITIMQIRQVFTVIRSLQLSLPTRDARLTEQDARVLWAILAMVLWNHDGSTETGLGPDIADSNQSWWSDVAPKKWAHVCTPRLLDQYLARVGEVGFVPHRGVCQRWNGDAGLVSLLMDGHVIAGIIEMDWDKEKDPDCLTPKYDLHGMIKD